MIANCVSNYRIAIFDRGPNTPPAEKPENERSRHCRPEIIQAILG